ncbi:MAG: glycosyltransferase family 39 protein [Planctomycetota bacterium]
MAPSPPTPAATPAPGGRRAAALALLVLLPLALRLAPIGHGLPTTSYVPDTHIVRGALGMAKEKTPVPPAGAYTSYPYLMPYLLLPIYAAQYGAGRAAGDWAGAGEYGMRLLEEPERAHLPARVLVALLGALTPWVVLRAARAMGLRAGAWVAAWLVATGLLHVHFSVQERPWVPMVLFLALASWGAAAYLAGGRTRALLASAAAAGLALATHQGGLLAVGIPGLAWIARPGGWSGAELAQRGKLALAGLAVFAGLAVAAGHPYLLVHGAPAAEHVSGGLGGDVQVGGQGFSYRFRAASLARMVRAFFGYDPALLVLALAGLPFALRVRAALPATVFALGWAAVFLTNFNDHVRYLLPLAVLLAPAAGFAAERLWSAAGLRWALVPLLALPLVQSARLGWVLVQPDTRALAAQRLAELDARVAIDIYGPDLPLDLASLERLAGWRELYAREAHRHALLEAGVEPIAGAGLDAVSVADLFDFEMRTHSSCIKPGREHLGATPDEILAGLGVTHVLLVDRNPGDGVPPFLIDPTPATGGAEKLPLLSVEAAPLFTVSPSERDAPWEARLPTELDFPLTSLWSVSRPGPLLTLYRLAEEDG